MEAFIRFNMVCMVYMFFPPRKQSTLSKIVCTSYNYVFALQSTVINYWDRKTQTNRTDPDQIIAKGGV